MGAEVKEIYLMPLLKLKNEPALALGTFYPTVYTFLTSIWINIIHLSVECRNKMIFLFAMNSNRFKKFKWLNLF